MTAHPTHPRLRRCEDHPPPTSSLAGAARYFCLPVILSHLASRAPPCRWAAAPLDPPSPPSQLPFAPAPHPATCRAFHLPPASTSPPQAGAAFQRIRCRHLGLTGTEATLCGPADGGCPRSLTGLGRAGGRTPPGPCLPAAPGLRRQRRPAHGRVVTDTPTPAGTVHAGSTPLRAHTPHAAPCIARRLASLLMASPPCPAPSSPLAPAFAILSPPSSPLISWSRPYASTPSRQRRGGLVPRVPRGPKSGVDPPRCFAGGALLRVGSTSLPVSATAHAARPSISPASPQPPLTRCAPR